MGLYQLHCTVIAFVPIKYCLLIKEYYFLVTITLDFDREKVCCLFSPTI